LSRTIQVASERNVQVHSAAVVMATLPEPPPAGKELDEVTALIEHFAALGDVSVDVDDEPQPPRSRRVTRPRKNPPSRTRVEGQTACQVIDLTSRLKRLATSSYRENFVHVYVPRCIHVVRGELRTVQPTRRMRCHRALDCAPPDLTVELRHTRMAGYADAQAPSRSMQLPSHRRCSLLQQLRNVRYPRARQLR
jgi:hypothetical protein